MNCLYLTEFVEEALEFLGVGRLGARGGRGGGRTPVVAATTSEH